MFAALCRVAWCKGINKVTGKKFVAGENEVAYERDWIFEQGCSVQRTEQFWDVTRR